ncbi:FAD-binding oxidoreductase [Castellaniella sp.]|uniref:FAD-binding oxidoreductase n=1 Tax=Castellaniella sp. TaxID=1955812 RepID=UPI00355E1AE4
MGTTSYTVEKIPRPLPDDFLDVLRAQFGTACSTNASVLQLHGADESPYTPIEPDAVIFARSVDDVVWLAKYCHQHHIPLIARGAGSSLEGQLLPVEGGISLDMMGMNRILKIHADDMQATVEPGVTREALNAQLHDTGLFFPVDPGADASFGGMVATRASGTNAVRYGTMRENVVNLKVVLADGRVINTGHRARKSSAGYDLTRLFVGSEGTLGIVVEVTVRLYPRPEEQMSAICNFDTIDDAVRTVIDIVQMGIPMSRVELMDVNTVRAVNQYSHLDMRVSPLLLMEFAGDPAVLQKQVATVQEITQAHHGQDFDWAQGAENSDRLWEARHKVYFAAIQLRPGCRSISTDVCVPISRLADCINDTAADLESAPFPYIIVGHVGDGNFHVQMLLNHDDPTEWAACEQINQRVVERAISMGGTCTGEHGVGLHKRDFLLMEYGAETLQLMNEIKAVLDSRNILNPGKILP